MVLEWQASPESDMWADAVLTTLLHLDDSHASLRRKNKREDNGIGKRGIWRKERGIFIYIYRYLSQLCVHVYFSHTFYSSSCFYLSFSEQFPYLVCRMIAMPSPTGEMAYNILRVLSVNFHRSIYMYIYIYIRVCMYVGVCMCITHHNTLLLDRLKSYFEQEYGPTTLADDESSVCVTVDGVSATVSLDELVCTYICVCKDICMYM